MCLCIITEDDKLNWCFWWGTVNVQIFLWRPGTHLCLLKLASLIYTYIKPLWTWILDFAVIVLSFWLSVCVVRLTMRLYSLIKDAPWSFSHKYKFCLYSCLIAKMFQMCHLSSKKAILWICFRFTGCVYLWLWHYLLSALCISDKFFAHDTYLLFIAAIKTLQNEKKHLLNVNLPQIKP